MNKSRATELYIIHLTVGFFTGLFILLAIVFLFSAERDANFTFVDFFQIHKNTPLFVVFDSLPFLGLITGYYIARDKVRALNAIDSYNSTQTLHTNIINAALKDLSIGNLNRDYRNEGIDAEIADNLKNLQLRLIENSKLDSETRKAENQRNWTSSGLAEFGDILRTFSNDLENLSYEVISNLVRYMNINQGGFFIIEENGSAKRLKMIASHAYNRKKFPDQVLDWGEGLIGAVAIEQKSYYTDKIPDGYLHITSGLGRATPRHLLIVPMIINNEVFGVFELAAFEKFESYHIEFVERLAENTATTLNIMKNNFRTRQLLIETQEQARKLAQQDEKVQQKIRELQQTQHQAAKQSEQFITFSNTVNHTLIRAEYDVNGNLLYANTRFLKMLGYPGNREIQDKHISFFIHDADWSWFENRWKKLTAGGEHFEGFLRHITKLGAELWTLATFTCARREDGRVENILFLAIDATEEKTEITKYKSRLKAFNNLVCRAEFSPDGKLDYSNELFRETLKYQAEEIEHKNIFDFFLPDDQEQLNDIWEQAMSGSYFQGQFRMIGKFELEFWFSVFISVTKDIHDETERVILLGFNISNEKALEITARNAGNQLNEKVQELHLRQLDHQKQIEIINRKSQKEADALKEELKVFTSYFENASSPSLMINNLSFLLHANKAAEKFFNFKRKSLINRKISDLLSEDQESQIIDHFVDPSKPFMEVSHKNTKILLKEGPNIEATVTISKVQLSHELIFILTIHPN